MSDEAQFEAMDDTSDFAIEHRAELAELDRAAAQRMQRMQEAGCN